MYQSPTFPFYWGGGGGALYPLAIPVPVVQPGQTRGEGSDRAGVGRRVGCHY